MLTLGLYFSSVVEYQTYVITFFITFFSHIAKQDPDVFESIQAETHRQEFEVELIASENYTSPAVLKLLVLL